MIALLVIDMQTGLFTGTVQRHDARGVIERINDIARALRAKGGLVVFVQHDGPAGDELAPGSEEWQLLPDLERQACDLVVRKTASDAFFGTVLAALLTQHAVQELIVTGCATDFCVDATVRAAASLGYTVTAVADGHTTADRPHLSAPAIIQHHNWIWEHLIVPQQPVRVLPAAHLIASLSCPCG